MCRAFRAGTHRQGVNTSQHEEAAPALGLPSPGSPYPLLQIFTESLVTSRGLAAERRWDVECAFPGFIQAGRTNLTLRTQRYAS